MPYNAVLHALIDEMNAAMPVGHMGWRSAQAWPDGALETLLKVGMLISAPDAISLECQGCENRCFMPIVWRSDETGTDRGAFIVCDDPDRQAQMGRIPVPLEQLGQWKISIQQIACVIAGLLEFDGKVSVQPDQDAVQLGMLQGAKGRRWISLLIDPLRLEVNGYEMPVQELLYFEDDQLYIDNPRIDDCLNRESRKEAKAYSPSTDRREIGKLATQAMYQDWRDEYRKLKKQFPQRTDTWIAKKIAKMEISQGKSEGRIRKMMKE